MLHIFVSEFHHSTRKLLTIICSNIVWQWSPRFSIKFNCCSLCWIKVYNFATYIPIRYHFRFGAPGGYFSSIGGSSSKKVVIIFEKIRTHAFIITEWWPGFVIAITEWCQRLCPPTDNSHSVWLQEFTTDRHRARIKMATEKNLIDSHSVINVLLVFSIKKQNPKWKKDKITRLEQYNYATQFNNLVYMVSIIYFVRTWLTGICHAKVVVICMSHVLFSK